MLVHACKWHVHRIKIYTTHFTPAYLLGSTRLSFIRLTELEPSIHTWTVLALLSYWLVFNWTLSIHTYTTFTIEKLNILYMFY